MGKYEYFGFQFIVQEDGRMVHGTCQGTLGGVRQVGVFSREATRGKDLNSGVYFLGVWYRYATEEWKDG